ncbi:DUF4397 domain-containing protein [Desertivibrio insolitus]|uniref:DUF4397 domain-containing protein n=1 Tax=Herbiconiux sp. SYSU D00978 TaxID=2812562 RepID=UPI001A967D29|nr:DUF4397 domain-containing protein [Herbiconiux sp. SYSU D00978]
MRTKLITGAALGTLAAFAVATPAYADNHESARLSVLHGVPDTPVDVYVDGALTIDDFQPGDLAGPLELPAGSYEVAITAPDAADASSPVIGPVTIELAAAGNYTAVAHLGEGAQPTATLFTNDVSPTAAGEGRLTVRHTAAAPAVDILAGGQAVVSGLTNPNEASLNLPASTVSAAVALAGTTQPVIGPADVSIEDGVHTLVYAWGSAEAGNLQLAVQTIDGLHSNPGGVNTGEAGLVAPVDDSVVPAAAAALLALLGSVAAAVVLHRRAAATTER